MREVGFEPVHGVVAQRWQVAVLFGRQALEPGVTRMHDEHLAAGFADLAHEVAHKIVILALVDTDAVLHGYRQPDRLHHRLDGCSHQPRFGHQAGAKRATLHPFGRAAAVQVDFGVTPLLTQFGAMREVGRFATAELQGKRMFFCVEAQMARHVAMHQRAGGHHLGVQQGVAAQEAVEVPAMTIGPIHHRCDAGAPPCVTLSYLNFLNHCNL